MRVSFYIQIEEILVYCYSQSIFQRPDLGFNARGDSNEPAITQDPMTWVVSEKTSIACFPWFAFRCSVCVKFDAIGMWNFPTSECLDCSMLYTNISYRIVPKMDQRRVSKWKPLQFSIPTIARLDTINMVSGMFLQPSTILQK